MSYKNWKLAREADGIAWAILDTANSSTNTLGAEVLTELGLILDECEKHVKEEGADAHIDGLAKKYGDGTVHVVTLK